MLSSARLHNFLPQRTLDSHSDIPTQDCTRQRAILGMQPNKFSTKSEGSERGREERAVLGGLKGGRNPSPLQSHTLSCFVFSSNRETCLCSGCGFSAWVPDMPGCVDLKECLKEHQRTHIWETVHTGIGYLRQWQRMKRKSNSCYNFELKRPAPYTIMFSRHMHQNTPLCVGLQGRNVPPLSKLTKVDKGLDSGGFPAIQLLK